MFIMDARLNFCLTGFSFSLNQAEVNGEHNT